MLLSRSLTVLSAGCCAAVLLTSTALPAPTLAASKALRQQARKMSNKAAGHFHAKRWQQAAELFEQAYALDPAKLIRLRNAGRAYEEAKLNERALHCFKRFAERTPDAKLKADAHTRIARLEKELVPKPAEPPPKAAPKPADADPIGAKSAPAVTDNAGSSSSKAASWFVIGSGGLAIAGGATLLAMTLSKEQEVDDGERDGLYSSADALAADRATISSNKTGAYAGLAVGAVVTGVGVWLLMSTDDEDGAKAATLAPMWSDGRAGMLASVRF